MVQRQRLIVGNWKMHKTVSEARDFIARLAKLLHDQAKVGTGGVEIIVAPPFTALNAVAKVDKASLAADARARLR